MSEVADPIVMLRIGDVLRAILTAVGVAVLLDACNTAPPPSPVVSLHVVDADGRLRRDFTAVLQVRRPEDADFWNQQRMPHAQAGTDETAQLEQLAAGEYRVAVKAEGAIRSYSPVFRVAAGQRGIDLVCRLRRGGTMVGRVIDVHGQPIADAVVKANGSETEWFVESVADQWPTRCTRAATRTDAAGAYRLPLLQPGEYVLRVRRPGYCESKAACLVVEDDMTTAVVDLVLDLGCSVEGTLRCAGTAVAGGSIQIGPPWQPALSAVGPRGAASYDYATRTDRNGHFRFDCLLHPGEYEIRASRSGAPATDDRDLWTTAQRLVIEPAEFRATVDFEIAR